MFCQEKNNSVLKHCKGLRSRFTVQWAVCTVWKPFVQKLKSKNHFPKRHFLAPETLILEHPKLRQITRKFKVWKSQFSWKIKISFQHNKMCLSFSGWKELKLYKRHIVHWTMSSVTLCQSNRSKFINVTIWFHNLLRIAMSVKLQDPHCALSLPFSLLLSTRSPNYWVWPA